MFQCSPSAVAVSDGQTGEFVFGPFLPGQWVESLQGSLQSGPAVLAAFFIGSDRATVFDGQLWVDGGLVFAWPVGVWQSVPVNKRADENARFLGVRISPTGGDALGWLSCICRGVPVDQAEAPKPPSKKQRAARNGSSPGPPVIEQR